MQIAVAANDREQPPSGVPVIELIEQGDCPSGSLTACRRPDHDNLARDGAVTTKLGIKP